MIQSRTCVQYETYAGFTLDILPVLTSQLDYASRAGSLI